MTLVANVSILGCDPIDDMCPECNTWSLEQITLAIGRRGEWRIGSHVRCGRCRTRVDLR